MLFFYFNKCVINCTHCNLKILIINTDYYIKFR